MVHKEAEEVKTGVKSMKSISERPNPRQVDSRLGQSLLLGFICACLVFCPWNGSLTAQEDLSSLFRKGESLLNSGDHAEAVAVFTKAINIVNPGDRNAHVITLARARAYLGKGDLKSALKDISNVIASQGVEGEPLASALQLRGIVKLRREQDKLALEDLTSAIKVRHENDSLRAGCFATRGMIHTKMGDTDMAISDLNKAVELDPNSGYAYACRGLAYLRQDRIELAKKDSEHAMRLSQDEQTQKVAQRVLRELSISATGPATVSVPIGEDGHLWVHVRFSKQGKPHRFMLDTGATESLINSDLLEEIRRETEVKQVGTGKVRTADGSWHAVTRYRAKTAFLFNLPLGEMDFHVQEKKGKKITNLLGMKSLRNIAVSIDNAEKIAQITRK